MRRGRCCGFLRTQGSKPVCRCASGPGPDRQRSLVPSIFAVTDLFFVQVHLSALLLQRDSNMSGSSVAELEHSAFEMSVYEHCPTASLKPTTGNSESNSLEDSRFRQMPAELPRTWTMGKFFFGIKQLASLVLDSIKEKIIQKFTIFRYGLVCTSATKALEAAATSSRCETQAKNIADFLEYDSQLIGIEKRTCHLPEAVLNCYGEQLRKIVKSHFDQLDEFVQATYNTCTYHSVDGKTYSELAPLHNFMVRVLEFYASTEEHRKIIHNQSRYMEI